jgi:hypothetical protein
MHNSESWAVIVEPQEAEKVLLIITAYKVEPL